jgi:hypothetical protein
MKFLGRQLLTGCAVLALVAFAVPALAQTPSLGDIAKKEQERRKGSKQPAKVYTNEDLKAVPGAPATETGSSDGAPAVAAPADSAQAASADSGQKEAKAADKDAKSADKDAGAPPDAKDEEAWHTRMTGARDEQRRNEVFAEALQSRINALTTDFAARDNPVERTQIADERQKALAELERVKNDIEKNKKTIAEIEEAARKAGVPPGWLR